MLDVLIRVISGGDIPAEATMSNSATEQTAGAGGEEADGMHLDESTVASPSHPTTGPALVENDMDVETPRSSLSDISASPRTTRKNEIQNENAFGSRESTSREQGRAKHPTPPIVPTLQNSEKLNVEQQGTRHLSSGTPGFGRSDSRLTERSWEGGSQGSSRDWGWFEDVHLPDGRLFQGDSGTSHADGKRGKDATSSAKGAHLPIRSPPSPQHIGPRDTSQDAAVMAVTAPNYVLEESLSNQKLWKNTAGQRPPQPVEERAFFEKMWAQNFARSQVEYKVPVEVLTATTPISLSPFADGNFDVRGGGNELSNYNLAAPPSGDNEAKKLSDAAEAALIRKLNDSMSAGIENDTLNHGVKSISSGGDTLRILVKGDNVFGTTVSKSFSRSLEKGGPIVGVDTVNISIASYRVVESKKQGKFAQFLVIYREGSIRDTIGVWKRYSDFQELSKKVNQSLEGCTAVIANMSPLAMTEEHEVEHLPNAITSWRLLKKRQRWYRCLDAGYLSLKVFLLERFLHDILFESSSPDLLREFVASSEE